MHAQERILPLSSSIKSQVQSHWQLRSQVVPCRTESRLQEAGLGDPAKEQDHCCDVFVGWYHFGGHKTSGDEWQGVFKRPGQSVWQGVKVFEGVLRAL